MTIETFVQRFLPEQGFFTLQIRDIRSLKPGLSKQKIQFSACFMPNERQNHRGMWTVPEVYTSAGALPLDFYFHKQLVMSKGVLNGWKRHKLRVFMRSFGEDGAGEGVEVGQGAVEMEEILKKVRGVSKSLSVKDGKGRQVALLGVNLNYAE